MGRFKGRGIFRVLLPLFPVLCDCVSGKNAHVLDVAFRSTDGPTTHPWSRGLLHASSTVPLSGSISVGYYFATVRLARFL
jgi:hypothetical protein